MKLRLCFACALCPALSARSRAAAAGPGEAMGPGERPRNPPGPGLGLRGPGVFPKEGLGESRSCKNWGQI